MNSILDADEVSGGLRAADAFWHALGRDDDPVLEDVLVPQSLSDFGAGPGLAARIRERLHISTDSCLCLGAVSPVLLAEDRRMRPTYTFTSVSVATGRDAQDAAWRIEVTDSDGVWRIDPTASHPLREVAHRWVSLSMVWAKIAAER